MKYVGLIAALAIACIFVMPALSMPDQDEGEKMDSKLNYGQAICGQHQICPQCHQPMGPMGDNDGKKVCQCKGFIGEHEFGPESVKNEEEPCHKPIKSMMDGKQIDGKPFCQEPIKYMMDDKCLGSMGPMGPMGEDGKQIDGNAPCPKPVKSMMDGKCQGPMEPMGPMGEDGKQIDGNAPCPKPVKSMIGDGEGEKGETAIFVLVCR